MPTTSETEAAESEERTLFLREGQVARLLGLSLAKTNAMGLAGEIPGRVRFNRAVRYYKPVLLAWLAQLAHGDE
jgi:hypothetical protein